MAICAYCDLDRPATREHIIPRWFVEQFSNTRLRIFNARNVYQKEGDLLIKDVCEYCNNVILGDLDNYGAAIYDQIMKSPVYKGDNICYVFDHSRLVRWLLKLCFNSGRTQNADITILRK